MITTKKLLSSVLASSGLLLINCGTADDGFGEASQGVTGTFTISSVHSGKCLDVAAWGTNDGAHVIQWDCHGGANQQWQVRDLGNGVHQLSSVHSGKCLDIAERDTRNGAHLQQWGGCGPETHRRFRLIHQGNGEYLMQAVHSGRCLDVTGWSRDNGAHLIQWDCHGGANQRFRLNPVNGGNDDNDDDNLNWRTANLTWYESYPDPGSPECVEYNGCTWAGQFAALDGKQPESWVRANNIAAVHGKDFEQYKLKTLRLRQGSHQIDVKVYDMCADSDCSGCCTANSSSTGFLIDIEKYTAERFGTRSGIVEWACLDC